MQNRVADQITRFAGSMRFVYIHIIWFAAWIGFRVEPFRTAHHDRVARSHIPVDLRNDQPEPGRREAPSPGRHQWQTVQQEEQQNEELCTSPTRSWSSPRPSTQ